jgi:hypothetical protein
VDDLDEWLPLRLIEIVTHCRRRIWFSHCDAAAG